MTAFNRGFSDGFDAMALPSSPSLLDSVAVGVQQLNTANASALLTATLNQVPSSDDYLLYVVHARSTATVDWTPTSGWSLLALLFQNVTSITAVYGRPVDEGDDTVNVDLGTVSTDSIASTADCRAAAHVFRFSRMEEPTLSVVASNNTGDGALELESVDVELPATVIAVYNHPAFTSEFSTPDGMTEVFDTTFVTLGVSSGDAASGTLATFIQEDVASPTGTRTAVGGSGARYGVLLALETAPMLSAWSDPLAVTTDIAVTDIISGGVGTLEAGTQVESLNPVFAETSGVGTLEAGVVTSTFVPVRIETSGEGILAADVRLTYINVVSLSSTGVGILDAYANTVLHNPHYLVSDGVGILDARVYGIDVIEYLISEGVGILDADTYTREVAQVQTAGLGLLAAYAITTETLLFSTGGLGLLAAGTRFGIINPVNIYTRGAGRMYSTVSFGDVINPTVRHVFQFTNEDETRVLEFPTRASGYEWTSRQDITNGVVATVGSDYGVDLDIPHKSPGTETIRFLLTRDNPVEMSDALDRLKSETYSIGRGKLWNKVLENRRWAHARIEKIPELTLGKSGTIIPVVLQFVRLSDWYEEVPIQSIEPIESIGGQVELVLENPGNAPTYGLFTFEGTFQNPILEREDPHGDEQVIVNVNGTGILTVDTQNMRVVFNGVDVSHLVSIPETQMGYMKLLQGDNTVRWRVGSGSFEASYLYYPAFH